MVVDVSRVDSTVVSSVTKQTVSMSCRFRVFVDGAKKADSINKQTYLFNYFSFIGTFDSIDLKI